MQSHKCDEPLLSNSTETSQNNNVYYNTINNNSQLFAFWCTSICFISLSNWIKLNQIKMIHKRN